MSEQEAGAAEGRRSRTQISPWPFPRSGGCERLPPEEGAAGGPGHGQRRGIPTSALPGHAASYRTLSRVVLLSFRLFRFSLGHLSLNGLKVTLVRPAMLGAQPCGPLLGIKSPLPRQRCSWRGHMGSRAANRGITTSLKTTEGVPARARVSAAHCPRPRPPHPPGQVGRLTGLWHGPAATCLSIP